MCIQRTNKNQSNTIYIWYNFNKLTPCSKIPLEKLTLPHMIRISPTLYVTRRFIAELKRHRPLSIYWARLIQSMPPFNFLKIHFNSIFPTRPNYFKQYLSLRLPTKPHKHLLSTPYVPHAHPSYYSWFEKPNNIWWGAQATKLLIM